MLRCIGTRRTNIVYSRRGPGCGQSPPLSEDVTERHFDARVASARKKARNPGGARRRVVSGHRAHAARSANGKTPRGGPLDCSMQYAPEEQLGCALRPAARAACLSAAAPSAGCRMRPGAAVGVDRPPQARFAIIPPCAVSALAASWGSTLSAAHGVDVLVVRSDTSTSACSQARRTRRAASRSARAAAPEQQRVDLLGGRERRLGRALVGRDLERRLRRAPAPRRVRLELRGRFLGLEPQGLERAAGRTRASSSTPPPRRGSCRPRLSSALCTRRARGRAPPAAPRRSLLRDLHRAVDLQPPFFSLRSSRLVPVVAQLDRLHLELLLHLLVPCTFRGRRGAGKRGRGKGRRATEDRSSARRGAAAPPLPRARTLLRAHERLVAHLLRDVVGQRRPRSSRRRSDALRHELLVQARLHLGRGLRARHVGGLGLVGLARVGRRRAPPRCRPARRAPRRADRRHGGARRRIRRPPRPRAPAGPRRAGRRCGTRRPRCA